MIILPGTTLFKETVAELQTLQIVFNSDAEYNFIALPGNNGLLEAVTPQRTIEYLEDGEYDQRLQEIGNDLF
ncbi:MAG: hypothetical protein IGS23_14050 [Rivularia sp. T60_A2020_040]|nr:hypothetical protein [Rivularia sp. T60_A2020_040]